MITLTLEVNELYPMGATISEMHPTMFTRLAEANTEHIWRHQKYINAQATTKFSCSVATVRSDLMFWFQISYNSVHFITV
jgi:hypothetical protein